MVGHPRKPRMRKWYPIPENDAFIEALHAAAPAFNQSAFINLLVTMTRVSVRGSVLDALCSPPVNNKAGT